MKDFLTNERNCMIYDLIELINIPSIFSEKAEPGRPFGKFVGLALEKVMALAESMNMNTKNLNGYAGEITIGDGEYMVGILGHIDVVEAGEGWTSEPFHAFVDEGKIYGRGSSDDKGPIISCLYAMKYLKENNLIPKGTSLRMILGTDEEELWRGIQYYTAHADRLPDCSIVPDGYFPVVFCEKGLLDFNLDFHIKECESEASLVEFRGGAGRNVVPSDAVCNIQFCNEKTVRDVFRKIPKTENIKVAVTGTQMTITSKGKACHAMAPDEGENAISRLIGVLSLFDVKSDFADFAVRYNKYIGMDYNGGLFGLGFHDEMSGKLTFNIGKITFDKGKVHLEGNLRHPASMRKEEITDVMKDTGDKSNFEYEEYDYLAPVFIEEKSPVFEALMSSYQRITGDVTTNPLAIGGATYARAIPGAVAFGALFPHEEEMAHKANEFLSIDSYMKMTEIYADALENLLKIKGE
ncbi:Sapep family Mn(2+)-dependent dipeptidase [Sinanaerobacter sp. ZZT-01]|uniref:Sapep family Mn(2+)-dependent dipeptidase n=1 Tax=Sinanaerobacter sp. ZZT-01 TaxID=3111540 RepID=UPI002D7A3787|nr:Sapep family Mn(2+)-dependent dipeptidase [Sinanaerobacter sp. ZZT-01]WRR92062.1 Sapep family Mn(2+)-dependent dipeptidase [Sinanaerobacter sp. ZZT-01]